ncbi:MAG: alkyl hydroperoxide reductase subunit F [Moraxellaceae bacterium]|nr:alkyl hydroperoxide reductase subunit F [Pseudobdellovibrionaceae bacterium]
MLDQDLKQQLSSVFEQLSDTVEILYYDSKHADQVELLSMLNDVASTSNKIIVRPFESKTSDSPEFEIHSQNYFQKNNTQETGIAFKGIPNGHEFSSLVIAILNADGKGKFPDEGIISRIKNIKGPIHLKTYISLTCENCPDVVQALNQIAVMHGNFTHQMIDGAYTQDEIEKLNIQGVPSVMSNGKLVHSGKISFIDLIEKLEKYFGIDEAQTAKAEVKDLGEFDVVVVGGGPAGASAAIYSARKGLSTVMIAEKFGGQVQDTKGIENLISVIYTEGPQLSSDLNKHLTQYPVKILEHRRVSHIDKETKEIFLQSGEKLVGKSIIIATGAKWRELNIPGEKDYMGLGVAYCPHCDGPFYKGKRVAVVGGGNSGVEAAIDLSGIVGEVTLFEYNDVLKADQILVDKLKSIPNAKIITNARTKTVIGDGKRVTALEYEDRTTSTDMKLELEGIFVQIGLLPNSGFLKETVELNKFGEIVVDIKGRTSVPGIYAAGDVTTTPFKQIIIAMGEGAKASLTAFEDRMYH